MDERRKKAWEKLMKEDVPPPDMSPTPTEMDKEGMLRAKEKTGEWRKRQGKGKPRWWENEY